MNALCGFHLHDARATHGLAAMLGALSDYGKTRAQWTEGAVGLGCRSAAATNGDGAGHSPCLDRDAGAAVAADARLDDRDTLCSALGVPHAERSALTEGSLILRAWSRWGRECPNHLLGDYAFAVWDARKRTLFCARDHAGVRPFYYAWDSERLRLRQRRGSRPRHAGRLRRAGRGHRGDLSDGSGWWNTTTRTFFKEVRKLPPGHTLTIEGDPFPGGGPRTRIERYWRPERTPAARPASDDAHAEEFLALYARAVEDRLCGGR